MKVFGTNVHDVELIRYFLVEAFLEYERGVMAGS